MVRRVLACATAVVTLGLVCYQYQSSRRLNEVQRQSRRVAEQAEIIKSQDQKLDSQHQQIESLEHQVQIQNGELQKRLTRLEGLLREQAKTAAETLAPQAPLSRTLRIYPSASYLYMRGNSGWCGPGTAQPCDVYQIGKDVQIGAVLINPSGQQISFRYIRWWPSTVLEVRDQSGHLVPETEELRTLKNKWFYDGEWSGPPAIDKQWMTGPSPEDVAVLPPHVGPGQSGQVSWGVNVSKHYDMSRPGKYSIIAKVHSFCPSPKWYQSNKIWVTISPKQPNE